MLRAPTTYSTPRRPHLLALAVALALATGAIAGGCDEPEPEDVPDFDPYTEVAAVRFVHAAPSLANVSVEVERPTRFFEVVDGEAVPSGEPELRSILPDAVIGFTAYTADYHVASPQGRVRVVQNTNVLAEEPAQLEAGRSYLVALIEGVAGNSVEVLPVWTPPVDEEGNALPGDGLVRVGALHANAALGVVEIVLAQGADERIISSLQVGRATLDAPLEVPPGTWELTIRRQIGNEPVAILAPKRLELLADTSVSLVLVPGNGEGDMARLLHLVDGVDEAERPGFFALHPEPPGEPR